MALAPQTCAPTQPAVVTQTMQRRQAPNATCNNEKHAKQSAVGATSKCSENESHTSDVVFVTVYRIANLTSYCPEIMLPDLQGRRRRLGVSLLLTGVE